MLSPLQRTTTPPSRRLEFGIYRDGDNNLDDIQADTLRQAQRVSAGDHAIEFTVEDATKRGNPAVGHMARTEEYDLADGHVGHYTIAPLHDMSSRANLAAFVAHTLDRAEQNHADQTWIELVNHGAGDAGGLEADSFNGGVMREDDIAGAIADGIAQHAREHPEDAARNIDGVTANQCLMGSLGFEFALSAVGVRYLAASPETMIAPGVPTDVAHAIADAKDPNTMAKDVVDATMDARYGIAGDTFGPAAAFDVFDLDRGKVATMTAAVATLNDRLSEAAKDKDIRSAIREDARTVPGMARFTKATMPWHADRPALALYATLAEDGRLPDAVRNAATSAGDAIRATVMAHREAGVVDALNGASYDDAAGPTVHFPVTARQVDPWAPEISETDTAFSAQSHEDRIAHRIA